VNLPGADASTNLDDRHYLGSLSFYPRPRRRSGGSGVASFLLDPVPALRRLPAGERLRDGDRLSVTLVLVPARAEDSAAGAALRVGRIRLVAA
jgi:hypothetical protein